MGAVVRKLNNTTGLKVIDGAGNKKTKRIKADGSVDKRYNNTSTKQKGVSSKVYFLNREEIELMKQAFLNKIDKSKTPTNELMNRRNYALFCMGINIGLRISDLIKLRWCDIFDKHWNFKEFTTIQPKKTARFNKYVTIAFNDSFKDAALEYKNEVVRLRDLPKFDDYIFWGKMDTDKPVGEKNMNAMLKDTAQNAGIKKNIGTHSLRKTFGYNFFREASDRGYALKMLQEWFGHDSSDTTLRYIGFTMEELINFVNSVNL